MRGLERTRTGRLYGLDITENVEFTDDRYNIPIMRSTEFIPAELTGFNNALTLRKDIKGAFHFFLDDYQIERVWRAPYRYIDVLKRAEAALTPDYSLYTDMSKSIQIYNVYRSRLLGAYYQGKGLTMIPTISWSTPESYEFAFLGLGKGGVVAISTVGIKRNKNARLLFTLGYEAMIKRLEPRAVLVYGGALNIELGGSELYYYDNDNSRRWKSASN